MSLFSDQTDDDYMDDMHAFSEPEYSQTRENIVVSPKSFHKVSAQNVGSSEKIEVIHLENNEDSDSDCQTPLAQVKINEDQENPFKSRLNTPHDTNTDLKLNIDSKDIDKVNNKSDKASDSDETNFETDSSFLDSAHAIDMIPPPAEFSDSNKFNMPIPAFFPSSAEPINAKETAPLPVVVNITNKNSRKDRIEAARQRFLTSDTPPASPVISIVQPVPPPLPPKPSKTDNLRPSLKRPSKPPPPPPKIINAKEEKENDIPDTANLPLLKSLPESELTGSPSTKMFEDWPKINDVKEEKETNSADKQWRPAHFSRRQHPIISGGDITLIRPGGYLNVNRTLKFAQNAGVINGTFTAETDSDNSEDSHSEDERGNAHKAIPVSPIDTSESEETSNSSSSDDDGNEFSCESRLVDNMNRFDSVDRGKIDFNPDNEMKILSISSIDQLQKFSQKHQDKAPAKAMPRPQQHSFPTKPSPKPKKKRLGSPPTRSKNQRGLPVIFEQSASLERAAELSESDKLLTPPQSPIKNVVIPEVLIAAEKDMSAESNMPAPIKDKYISVDPPAQYTSTVVTTPQSLSIALAKIYTESVGPPTLGDAFSPHSDKTVPTLSSTVTNVNQYDKLLQQWTQKTSPNKDTTMTEPTQNITPVKNVRQVNVPLFEGFSIQAKTPHLTQGELPRFYTRNKEVGESNDQLLKKTTLHSEDNFSIKQHSEKPLQHNQLPLRESNSEEPKEELLSAKDSSIQSAVSDIVDHIPKGEQSYISYYETDIDHLSDSEHLESNSSLQPSQQLEISIKPKYCKKETTGASMEQLTRPPLAPKPKPPIKPDFKSNSTSHNASYVKLTGFEHKPLTHRFTESQAVDPTTSNNSPETSKNKFNSAIRVKLPGFDKPSTLNNPKMVSVNETSATKGHLTNNPNTHRFKPGAIKDGSSEPIKQSPVTSKTKPVIISDSESWSYSSSSYSSSSESESEEAKPKLAPVKAPPVKVQLKQEPVPILNNQATPVKQHLNTPDTHQLPKSTTNSPSSIPKNTNHTTTAALSWSKNSSTATISTKLTAEKVVTLKNPTTGSSSTATPFSMMKYQGDASMGLGKVMVKSEEVSLVRPQSQPKPILKPDKKDSSKPAMPSKSVTLSSDTKKLKGSDSTDTPKQANSSAAKHSSVAQQSVPSQPKSAPHSNMTVEGTKPAPRKKTEVTKHNLSNPPKVSTRPTTKKSSESAMASDITEEPVVLQQMVDDILHSREEDQIEAQRDVEIKEHDRQRRREEESKKDADWKSKREPSKNQRSNEITDNIIEMDKAIDHVATHITNIDETLDKMKDFNRTMMNSLENLSDGEVSLPDVEVDHQMVQTDSLSGKTKGKVGTGASTHKKKKKGRTSSSSDSSDSTSSESSKEGKRHNKGNIIIPNQQKQDTIPKPDPIIQRSQVPENKTESAKVMDVQPNLRHLAELGRHPSDSSSLCEEPERLAMREKLQRFERKIDRISGKFKSGKPPPDLPTRLKLDYVPLDGSEQMVPGYENTGLNRNAGYEDKVPRSSFDPKDAFNKNPVPMPRKGSGDTLERNEQSAPKTYEDMAAAIMENRRRKDRIGSEEITDASSPGVDNQTASKKGKSPLYGSTRDKRSKQPSESDSITGESSAFKKSLSLTAKSQKKHPGSKTSLSHFDEEDESSGNSIDDSDEDTFNENGDQKGRYVRGGTARGRMFQRGGSALRASARTKSVENMLTGEEKSGNKYSRRASHGDGDAFNSGSDSDQELQSLYDSIAGRQGGPPTHHQLGYGQQSRSKSYDDLGGGDVGSSRASTLQPTVGASPFQRAYRGGVEQRLRASLASSMRSIPDVRGKGNAELAQLLQSYIDAGREEKIRGILKMLMRDDATKIDDLLSRFNDDFRGIIETKVREAGLSAEDADSVFNMAYSMSDLHNGLMPGVNSLEAGGGLGGIGSGGSLLQDHPHYRAGLADLGLGSGSTLRVIYQRPGDEEGPPPAMKPKPKPSPPALPKSTLVQDWDPIDNAAVEVSNLDITTFTHLVEELTRDCKSDVERVRALFRWITVMDYSHMDFDPMAPPESLLGMMRGIKHRQLSNNEIFHKLCRYAGIHCEYIPGYSKGAGYRPGMNLKDNRMFRNIWTAVFVGGAWRFVNCNWGARYLSTVADSRQANPMAGTLSSAGNVQYHLANAEVRCRCDEFYFLTDPQEHIFEHFPDDKRWQLLRKSITLEQFMRLPILKSPFFNSKMALKKKYAETLITKSGSVSLKIQMPHFVAISCTLENRADMSLIRGLTLIRVIDDTVLITAAPSQPGKYYLNVYISENWQEEEARELACSFQVHCSEHNYDRLVHGRFPDIGFLGRTPAAQKFGVAFNERTDPYIIWNDSKELRIPITLAPGLKVCHQMKSFDRPGQHSADCDNYAVLQTTDKQAYYTIRFPLEAFYYLMVFASKDTDVADDSATSDQLECVYRFLLDVRKGQDRVLPYPRQTTRWNGCYIRRPDVQHLELNRKYEFRLEAPNYVAISVVINGKTWIDFTASKSGVWSKKVYVGDELGELSVYGRTSVDDDGTFVKLLDYALIQKVSK